MVLLVNREKTNNTEELYVLRVTIWLTKGLSNVQAEYNKTTTKKRRNQANVVSTRNKTTAPTILTQTHARTISW